MPVEQRMAERYGMLKALKSPQSAPDFTRSSTFPPLVFAPRRKIILPCPRFMAKRKPRFSPLAEADAERARRTGRQYDARSKVRVSRPTTVESCG